MADTATVGDFLLPKRNRADTPNVAPIGVFSAEDPAPGPVAVPAVDAPEVAELFRCIPDGLLVRLADVTLVRVLGKGAFGEAHLAVVRGRGNRVVKVPTYLAACVSRGCARVCARCVAPHPHALT